MTGLDWFNSLIMVNWLGIALQGLIQYGLIQILLLLFQTPFQLSHRMQHNIVLAPNISSFSLFFKQVESFLSMF